MLNVLWSNRKTQVLVVYFKLYDTAFIVILVLSKAITYPLNMQNIFQVAKIL